MWLSLARAAAAAVALVLRSMLARWRRHYGRLEFSASLGTALVAIFPWERFPRCHFGAAAPDVPLLSRRRGSRVGQRSSHLGGGGGQRESGGSIPAGG